MKFSCRRKDLLKAVAEAKLAAPKRTPYINALKCARLDFSGNTLTVTCSDLDVTIKTTADVDVDGDADGAWVIPVGMLYDVVRALPDHEIELEWQPDDESVLLKSGQSEFSIRVTDEESWPELDTEEADEAEAVVVDRAEFVGAVNQTNHAVGTDDTRPILTGVLIEQETDAGIKLVATDSYRLSVRDMPGASVLASGKSVIVPGKALKYLASIASNGDEELSVRMSGTHAQFSSGGMSLTARLIEGKYPNYKGLIPEDQPNKLTVDRYTMLNALKRVKLLAVDSIPVRIAFNDDNIGMRTIQQDVGSASDEIPAEYAGEPMTIGFNPSYLIDALSAMTSDEVELRTNDPLKPAVLRSAEENGDGYLVLIMPVRVS